MRKTCRTFLALISVFATSTANGAWTRSVRFAVDDNRILVRGDVAATDHVSHNVRIWIDTGNPHMWITATLAEALGLKRLSPDQETPSGKAFTCAAPLELLIDGLHLSIPKGTVVVAFEAPTVGPGLAADVSVPAAAWAQSDLKIDYRHSRLTIDTSDRRAHSGARMSAHVDPATSLIRLPLSIDGVTYLAGLDVGASYSFADQRLLDAQLAAHRDLPRVIGSPGPANVWGWPGEERATVIRLPAIKWGLLDLRQLGIAPLPSDSSGPLRAGDVVGVIGGNLLKHCVLEIDYRHSVVYFDHLNYRDDDDLAMVGLTLRPLPNGQYLILGIVQQGSVSTVVGAQPNDRLMAVDGIAVTNLTMGAVIEALRGKPGDIKRITLEREGKRYDINASVRPLLTAAPMR